MKKFLLISFTYLLFAGIALGCKNRPNTTEDKSLKPVKSNTTKVKEPVEFDTITTKRIHETTSDKVCLAEIEMDYPVNGPQYLIDSLRNFLSNELYKSCLICNSDEIIDHSIYKGDLQNGAAMAKFYTQACFKKLKLDAYQDRSDIQLEHNIGIEKQYEDSKVITYCTSGYAYLGGAHGMAWQYGSMINKADGRVINDYIIDSTKVKTMQPLLEKGLKEYFKGADSPVNGDVREMLQIESDLIPLPSNNPYFTKDGVTFVYGQYEIGAYAIGMPTFTIPYKDIYAYLTPQIKKLLMPNKSK